MTQKYDTVKDETFGHEIRTFSSRLKGKSYKDIGPEKEEEYKPNAISYNFVNAFPISIQDIPLNYQNCINYASNS